MEELLIIFIFCYCAKIHIRIWLVIRWAYYRYRIKTVFHYIEYRFQSENYHTRRSGPLNDLEGSGLICEIKQRGGVVLLHKEGSFDYIDEMIEYRKKQIAEWRSQNTIIEG